MNPICYACGRPIRPTDNKTVIEGETYHMDCWDREQSKRRLPQTAA